MTRLLIPSFLAISFLGRAEDAIWKDNMPASSTREEKVEAVNGPTVAIASLSPALLGKRVRLEVEIVIERDVPLAIMNGPEPVGFWRHVHLISATTAASELKKGRKYFIEGMVVDGPCYGAYMVYVYGFYTPTYDNPSQPASSDGGKPATASVVKPDPWKSSDYSVLAADGRLAAYIGRAPVVLDAKLRNKNPKSYLEAIESFGPAFTSRTSSVGLWEWHFDDGMIYRVQPCWSGPLAEPISLKLEKTDLRIIEKNDQK